MVTYSKCETEPASLAKRQSYREEDVIQQLAEDFHDKCYLCETKNPTGINVEHFIEHHGNDDLKYDWHNLFYSCPHCNNTKQEKCKDGVSNLLNCTKPEDKVDETLIYRIGTDEQMRAHVAISINEDCPHPEMQKVEETKELLNWIYEGRTPIKEKEAEYITKAIEKEVNTFLGYAMDYLDSPTEANKQKVIEALQNDTPYTAFKRWIVRDNDLLREEFLHSWE